jgi:undecaprenyl-diphosphatase
MLQPPRVRAFPSARTLLTIAIVAAIAGSIVAVAVAQGWTSAFDEALLFAVRGSGPGEKPFGPVWFHEAVRDITALGSMIVLSLVVIGGASYFLASARFRLAGLLVGSSLAATAYSTGLKMLFDRPRPGLVTHEMATFTASFPSGHALLSAAILLTNGGLLAFAARQRNERIVIASAAVLLTTMVGVSRIFLGVHWPSDVLAGWLFGTVWASLTLLWARTFYPQPHQYLG